MKRHSKFVSLGFLHVGSGPRKTEHSVLYSQGYKPKGIRETSLNNRFGASMFSGLGFRAQGLGVRLYGLGFLQAWAREGSISNSCYADTQGQAGMKYGLQDSSLHVIHLQVLC